VQTDVQLRYLSLRNRYDLDARKSQLLEQRCDILLIAGKSVESFRYNDVEGACPSILQEFLVPGAKTIRSTDGMVRVSGGQSPAFSLNTSAAEPHLILDRGIPLKVGGVPGIDGGSRYYILNDAFHLS
jgi:hypothetical protein